MGLSIATLLAQHNEVVAVDVIPEKVEKINNRISPIQDEYIEKFFAEKELNLRATLDGREAYKDAEFVAAVAHAHGQRLIREQILDLAKRVVAGGGRCSLVALADLGAQPVYVFVQHVGADLYTNLCRLYLREIGKALEQDRTKRTVTHVPCVHGKRIAGRLFLLLVLLGDLPQQLCDVATHKALPLLASRRYKSVLLWL